jgi:hypothetical protein
MSKQKKKKPGGAGAPARRRVLSDDELREEFDAHDPILGEIWEVTRRLDVIDMAVGDELPEGYQVDAEGALETLSAGQVFTWTMTEILKALEQLAELRQRICIDEYRAIESKNGAAGEGAAAAPSSTEVA